MDHSGFELVKLSGNCKKMQYSCLRDRQSYKGANASSQPKKKRTNLL